MDALNRLCTPEFRNRLDATVSFASLPPEVISKVVEKFIFELEAQLHDRNVTIELTSDANAWLAAKGFDDKFGARALSRVIQEHIKRPLADELLFGKLKSGGVVRVIVKDKDGTKGKRLDFEYLEGPAAKIKPGSGKKGMTGAKKKSRAKTLVQGGPKTVKRKPRSTPPKSSGSDGSSESSPVHTEQLPAK